MAHVGLDEDVKIDVESELVLSRACSLAVKFNDGWLDQSWAVSIPGTRLNTMRCRVAETAHVSAGHVNVTLTGGSITLRFTVLLSDALSTQPLGCCLHHCIRWVSLSWRPCVA